MFSSLCLFISDASVVGGRMGSNLFTGGGGRGAACVFILLMILEAAKIGTTKRKKNNHKCCYNVLHKLHRQIAASQVKRFVYSSLKNQMSLLSALAETLCCVLGQDTLLSQCLSLPRWINGYYPHEKSSKLQAASNSRKQKLSVGQKVNFIVVPPNSYTFSDWRRTCHMSWVKTY